MGPVVTLLVYVSVFSHFLALVLGTEPGCFILLSSVEALAPLRVRTGVRSNLEYATFIQLIKIRFLKIPMLQMQVFIAKDWNIL